jgi:hypothetical protein
MSGVSPSSVLFSSDGYELAVVDGAAFVANTRSLLIAGNDGANTRTVLIDSTGRQVVVGAGTAGSQAGGVITIQGDPAGTAVPISGTVAATQSGAWTVAATQSGAWSVSVTGTVDVTQNTSPWVVSGTVTSNQGTPNSLANSWPITITDGYGNIQGSSVNPVYVQGNITANNSSVGADDGVALGFDTQVGGIVSTAAPTYTNGDLKALSLTTLGGLRVDGVYAVATANATAANVMNSGGYVTTAAPTYTTGQLNPLSLDTSGNLRVTGFVTTNKAATSNVTSVNTTANTNVTLLAADSTRVFASIFNNSGKTMYIKLGATASTTSFTVQLFDKSYWEVPDTYTGQIDAFALGTGTALVTELTP